MSTDEEGIEVWGTRRRRSIWGRALLATCIACLAATSGVAFWNAMRPWASSLEAAISESEHVQPNTPDAKLVAARLQLGATEAVRALRSMEARGDQCAATGLADLRHRLEVNPDSAVTLTQIRMRLAGMSDADFVAWIRGAMK